MTAHPFSQYIQILGKGRHGSRDMTLQEAEQAMSMILSGQVEPVQLGAFLMLMRVKEETADEVAGFVRAARASLLLPADTPAVELNWASYAGKRRHLPWYVLSALLLASHGVSVLMHGVCGGSDGRVYAPDALRILGVSVSGSLAEAADDIQRRCFAFIPIEVLSPDLARILSLKPLLGLRSSANTIVRMLNPYSAPTSIVGIFHPGYDSSHQQAAVLLKDQNLAVFKGEGGESERNPDTDCRVKFLCNGVAMEEVWPAVFQNRHLKDAAMDASRLAAVWQGEIHDEYGRAAVIGTVAIALRAMGRAPSVSDAEDQAVRLWDGRDPAWISRLSKKSK